MRGREQELRIAAEILRGARQGHGGVFLIEGEPGMGKSELLGEMARRAASDNFRVAAAGADELGGLMPLSPLLAALREPSAQEPSAQEPSARPEADRSEITSARDDDNPDDNMAAIDETVETLRRRAEASPMLVTVDDLHFADRATLLALRMLPRRLAPYPVVWSLARRPQRGGAAVLFDLLQRGGATRVTLGPLGEDAVAGLIAEAAGAEPDPGLAALAAGASGNPSLLIELLCGLREENAIRVTSGTAVLTSERLPQRVRAVARRMLDSLSVSARHLLETAAVLGPSFRLEDMAGMLGETPAVLLPLVSQAADAGILSAGVEDFAFRHELIWRAVAEAVPPPARQALHRQFGEMLLARGGSAMAAASHLLKGTRRADAAALGGLDAAADQVLRSSPPTAADLAVRALELTPPADPARLPRVVRAAGALTAAGRLDEASGLVRAALAEPQPPAKDTQLRAVLSSVLGLQGHPERASAEAGTALGTPYLTGRARDEALITQLHALIALGENQRARDVAESVLAGAEQFGKAALGGALSVLAAISWEEGRLGQGLHLAREAVRRSGGISPDTRHFQPLLVLAARLIDIRRLDEATEIIHVAANRIGAFRSGASEAIPGILRARVELAMGHTEDARAQAEAALGIADARGAGTHSSLARSLLSVIALRAGDLRAAGQHARSRPDVTYDTDSYARTETLLATAQFMEAATGPETAVRLLGEVYAGLPAHRHVLAGEPTASAWLARTALAAGNYELATGVARVADEIARDNPAIEVVKVAAAHCGGLVGRDPVRLAHAAAGHHDPWARASASEDLGNVLAGGAHTDDAVTQLDKALEGYGQTGAARDLARVRRRLRRLGVRRRHWVTAQRPAAGWASLTETEKITSRLAAQGLSNPQIAERMYVSVHTVAFHLRHVFRKLDISSRVELAHLVPQQAGAQQGAAATEGPPGPEPEAAPPAQGPGLWRERWPAPAPQAAPARAPRDQHPVWPRRRERR